MPELAEHVANNRAYWNELADEYATDGLAKWASEESASGIFEVPESQLHVLPEDVEGLETIELGCGTGYVSAWLARRGARPTGIDNSEAQLETARELQERFGIEFPLLHGNAEAVPLADASFDLAISEYCATLVRPLQVDPRGGAVAASRWTADLSSSTGSWRCSATPTKARTCRPASGWCGRCSGCTG